MKTRIILTICTFCFFANGLLLGIVEIAASGPETQEITILQEWRGNYPVSEIQQLPKEQRTLPIGYLDNQVQFNKVWQAFKPGEKVPEIDFRKNFVIFARNVNFYNRVGIASTLLKEGVADILIMATMSALPIEEEVGMALAVIPRAGVKYIAAGSERIPVVERGNELASDPLNGTYEIEEQKISLESGRSEIPVSSGSASIITTKVFGDPLFVDLDADGDDDAVLILVHNTGGSGTFYYIAAAININGAYRGTNTVFLGDRITFEKYALHNGVIEASYLGRTPDMPMTGTPNVPKRLYLILEKNELTALKFLKTDEQVVAGWVTVGHEIRSFQPCSQDDDNWIRGDSPALEEILTKYRQVMIGSKPYTPLFMILIGKSVKAPADGFGADYDTAFLVTQLVDVRPNGNCHSDLIIVDAPASGETLVSPFEVRGRARGTWFFEGDFPVLLKDENDNIISKGFARAKEKWMTEKFVPFEGTMKFKKPADAHRGKLVLLKDNPTGRSELDAEIRISVFFE